MAPRPLDRSFFATAVIVQRVADDGVLRKKKKAKLQFADIMHSLIIGREVLILTLYVLLTLQGCIS